MMIDLGTGNNNKINWPMEDGQELIDIIEVCVCVTSVPSEAVRRGLAHAKRAKEC